MSGPFNKKNFFGKHCLWAMIPGWYENDFDGVEANADEGNVGYWESVGQRQVFVDGNRSTGSTQNRCRTVTKSYGHLGTLRAVELRTFGSHSAYPKRIDGDLGIQFPDPSNLSIVGIFRPNGDGRGSGGDPRIYSKDIGTAEGDHDLMLGIASLTKGRCRIRLGISVRTILTSTDIQADRLNLVAGGAYKNGAGSNTTRGWCAHIREDGGYSDAEHANDSNPYEPRTTTDTGIGANANGDGNNYDGDIIGVWAFDNSLYKEETLLREFFANPWQVFAPQRIHVPMIPTEIVSVQEGPGTTVIITDVNGTETWIDGATGLVITGSGFT